MAKIDFFTDKSVAAGRDVERRIHPAVKRDLKLRAGRDVFIQVHLNCADLFSVTIA